MITLSKMHYRRSVDDIEIPRNQRELIEGCKLKCGRRLRFDKDGQAGCGRVWFPDEDGDRKCLSKTEGFLNEDCIADEEIRFILYLCLRGE